MTTRLIKNNVTKIAATSLLCVLFALTSGCCNCDKTSKKEDAELAKIRALLEKDEARKKRGEEISKHYKRQGIPNPPKPKQP